MHQNEKVLANTDVRKKRISRLKKIIISIAILFLLIPTILCIILFMKVSSVEKKLDKITQTLQVNETDTQDYQHDQEEMLATATMNAYEINSAEKTEEAAAVTEQKTAFLTFDDGPSDNTDDILDILKQYNVKATFFVVGKEDDASLALYKRIVEEGHTIGMHSYSHKYEDIYASLDAFAADLTRIQTVILNATGVKPMLYRFPGGSSNEVSDVDMNVFANYLTEQGITYVDWNVTAGDAEGNQSDVNAIIDDVFKNINYYTRPVILMHDAKDKQGTIEALPQIITRLQENNYKMEAINKDMNLVQHLKMK